MYGGQVLGQLIQAAASTYPDKSARSLHTAFSREGRHGTRPRADGLPRCWATTPPARCPAGCVVSSPSAPTPAISGRCRPTNAPPPCGPACTALVSIQHAIDDTGALEGVYALADGLVGTLVTTDIRPGPGIPAQTEIDRVIAAAVVDDS